jgi:hypothetical protein
MRVEIVGQARDLYERRGNIQTLCGDEFIFDLWGTLDLVRRDLLSPGTVAPNGRICLYIRAIPADIAAISKAQAERLPVKFSKGKYMIAIGRLVGPGHVRYHRIETYPP